MDIMSPGMNAGLAQLLLLIGVPAFATLCALAVWGAVHASLPHRQETE
jgi:hypothetical protein